MYKFTTKLFIGQRQNSLFLLRVNTRDLITSNAKVVINILTENDSANIIVHMEVKDFVFGIRAMSCILAVFAIISSVFLFNSSLTELIITLSILVGLAIGLIIMIRMMKIAFEKDVNKVVSFIKKII